MQLSGWRKLHRSPVDLVTCRVWTRGFVYLKQPHRHQQVVRFDNISKCQYIDIDTYVCIYVYIVIGSCFYYRIYDFFYCMIYNFILRLFFSVLHVNPPSQPRKKNVRLRVMQRREFQIAIRNSEVMTSQRLYLLFDEYKGKFLQMYVCTYVKGRRNNLWKCHIFCVFF